MSAPYCYININKLTLYCGKHTANNTSRREELLEPTCWLEVSLYCSSKQTKLWQVFKYSTLVLLTILVPTNLSQMDHQTIYYGILQPCLTDPSPHSLQSASTCSTQPSTTGVQTRKLCSGFTRRKTRITSG